MLLLAVALSAALGLTQPWLYATVNARGPAQWGNLFPDCVTNEQSPIDIRAASIDGSLRPLIFSYVSTTSYSIVHYQSTVRIAFDGNAGGSVTDQNMGGKIFDLKYFDIRAPAEHAVEGRYADAELQLIHEARPADQQPDGVVAGSPEKLAIAILFAQGGTSNAPLNIFLNEIPDPPVAADDLYRNQNLQFNPNTRRGTAALDMTSFLPVPWSVTRTSSKEREYFTYQGSFTSPLNDCEGGLRWYVYAHPLNIGASQLTLLRERLGVVASAASSVRSGFKIQNCEVFGNNRPPQSLNGRVVLMYTLSGIAEVGDVIGATDTSVDTTAATCNGVLQQPWIYPDVASRGPSSWSTIRAQGSSTILYGSCGGAQQSPVDLRETESTVASELLPLDFQYGTVTGYSIVNDGAAIQITFPSPPGYVRDPNTGKRFELTHVVFRTPSEHPVNGGYFAMEMQLMHRETIGQESGAGGTPDFLGVSVLFDIAASDNSFLQKFWGFLVPRPVNPGTQLTNPYLAFSPLVRGGVSEPLDLLAGLPAARGYYTYDGSLTEPPCTEQTRWYVYTTPSTMSQAQLDQIYQTMNFTAELNVARGQGYNPDRCTMFGNNRPVNPIGNSRTVRRTADAPSQRGRFTAANALNVECTDQVWLYADVQDRGPSDWGRITDPVTSSALYERCSSGRLQAPIQIDRARLDDNLKPLTYAYTRDRAFTIENWQSVMKLVYQQSPGYVVDNNLGQKRFDLKEFHIRSPSEHGVGEGLHRMELVLVHEEAPRDLQPATAISFASTRYLHVAILFDISPNDNIWLNNFWQHLQNLPLPPTTLYSTAGTRAVVPTVSQVLTTSFDITGILPANQDFFMYDGSKTEPPCTEGVKWYVYSTPVGMSSPQLTSFRNRMQFSQELVQASRFGFVNNSCEVFGNNRPVQNVGTRTVRMFSRSGLADSGAVQGATKPDAPDTAPGTTVTTSRSDVVQIIDPTDSTGGSCGTGGTGYQPWGYADVADRGPSDWGRITSQSGTTPLFPTCSEGNAQSPVDITQTVTNANLRNLVYNYNTVCEFYLQNNQRAQVVTVKPSELSLGTAKRESSRQQRKASRLAEPPDSTPSPPGSPTASCKDARSLGYLVDPNLGQKRFELTHIEFHAPSEHAYNGGLYDMEVQFHHREAIGQPTSANRPRVKRLVVAVFMSIGATNTGLEPFWNSLLSTPLQPGSLYTSAWQSFSITTTTISATLNPTSLIPVDSDFVTYTGSITVPPCTEDVQWYVYTTPLQLSSAQLELFRTRMGFNREQEAANRLGFSASRCSTFGNNRPVQPLNNRVLQKSGAPGELPPGKGPVTSVHDKTAVCTSQPWLYTETENRGPSNWGTIQAEGQSALLYPECSPTNSREQSPIDISAAVLDQTLAPLAFQYGVQTGYSVENNQKNGRVMFQNEDGLSGHMTDPNMGNKRFDLVNLHFHSPSEHSINGGLYDMEMHIVHRESGPSLQTPDASGYARYTDLVVTVLFELQEQDNPWLSIFWQHLQNTPITPQRHYEDPFAGFQSSRAEGIATPLNILDAVPENREYFTYDGSFTEPPCTQGVKWYVYRTPVGVSAEQLRSYRTSMNLTGDLSEAAKRNFYPQPCTTYGNNRPVQPLNGRTVSMSGTSGVAGQGELSGSTAPGGHTSSRPPSVEEATCQDPPQRKPWLYSPVGSRGPTRWGTVQASSGGALYPTCGTGTQQAPINMDNAVVDEALRAPEFRYNTLGDYLLENDQAAIHLTFKAGQVGAAIDPNTGNTQYELTRITFRAPSEHTVGGKHFAMEMQLMHKRATGQPSTATGPETLGLAVLFREGEEDTWLSSFWQRLPGSPLEPETEYTNPSQMFRPSRQEMSVLLDIRSAIPSDVEYFTYDGSETSPPCTEGKKWMVFSNPRVASPSQINTLRGALGLGAELEEAAKNGFEPPPCTTYGNIRPVQAIGTRTVAKSPPAASVTPVGTITGATDPDTSDASCAASGGSSTGGAIPWYYADVGGRGPSSWGTLRDQAGQIPYPSCSTGTQQSPLSLDVPVVDTTLRDLQFSYRPTGIGNTFRLVNDGHVVKLMLNSPGSAGFIEDLNQNGRVFALAYIEFRTPSEHTINDGRYNMEMQIYHQAATAQPPSGATGSSWVVISVLFDAGGGDNSFLSALWEFIPAGPVQPSAHFENPFLTITPSVSAEIDAVFDFEGVLPASRDLFSYDGSFTAPPCTEGARRYIYSSSVSMSQGQWEALRSALNLPEEVEAARAQGVSIFDPLVYGNTRPEQASNGRVVRYSSATTPRQGPLSPTPIVVSVTVPAMGLTGLPQSTLDTLSAAARRDFSAAYGVSSSLIDVSVMQDASTGGAIFFHTVDTSRVDDPGVLADTVARVYDTQSLRMPETEAAYRAATGNAVQANIDYTRSGPSTSGSTSNYIASGYVDITSMDLTPLNAGGLAELEEAAERDLAATYGVHPSRVAVTIFPEDGGARVQHTVNTLGLLNATSVVSRVGSAFSNRLHTFPITEATYERLTGRDIDINIDYPPPGVVHLPVDNGQGSGARNLNGRVFAMSLTTAFNDFDESGFVASISGVTQGLGLAVQMLWVCPGEVCPALRCIDDGSRTFTNFENGGCQHRSTGRNAAVLQSDGTYVEFDLIPPGSALQDDANALRVRGMERIEGAYGNADPITDVPPLSPLRSPPGNGNGNDSNDSNDEDGFWWWWILLLVLAVLLLLCLLFLCCHYQRKKKKKKGGKQDGYHDDYRNAAYQDKYSDKDRYSDKYSDKQSTPPKSLYSDDSGKEPSLPPPPTRPAPAPTKKKVMYEMDERRSVSSEGATGGYPPGCPVDVNYNGEWQGARIVSQEEDGTYTVDWGQDGMVTRGVHPADIRPRTEGIYCVGDGVLAWYEGEWYPAVITACHPNGTYDVNWGDGTASKGLTAAELRLDSTAYGVEPVIDADYASPNRHLVGQQVDVLWEGEWSIGTVVAANSDGSVLIQWPDGTYSDGVDPTLIRPVRNPIDALAFDSYQQKPVTQQNSVNY